MERAQNVKPGTKLAKAAKKAPTEKKTVEEDKSKLRNFWFKNLQNM